MKYIVAIAVLLCLSTAVVGAHLEYSRVHLVDHDTESGNFLFRGNMPTNETGFAYDQLVSYMRNRTAQAGLNMPSNFYMIDISLNNIFDGQNFWNEMKFWKEPSSANLGEFINWPLGLAGILPPNIYNETLRKQLALNGTVWKVDQIPTRIATIRKLLQTKADVPRAIYVHCTAGCDRTGEVIGSYRMTYQIDQVQYQNVTGMYALDVTECGRPPNYWSTTALEWFCYYHQYLTGQNIGNCMGFATCKMFGDCEPTQPIPATKVVSAVQ